MIYIDTRDQLSLKHGVMEFLNVTEEELELVFETIDSVDEDPYDWVKKYLEDYGMPEMAIKAAGCIRRFEISD